MALDRSFWRAVKGLLVVLAVSGCASGSGPSSTSSSASSSSGGLASASSGGLGSSSSGASTGGSGSGTTGTGLGASGSSTGRGTGATGATTGGSTGSAGHSSGGTSAGSTGGLACASPSGGTSGLQPTATITIDSSTQIPVAPGYSGFNSDLANDISYLDMSFQSMAAGLQPGWLRYPAGTESDAFDLLTGALPGAMVDTMVDSGVPAVAGLAGLARRVAARGGATLPDFAQLATASGAVGIVVCLNVFTDDPATAGQLAADALDAGINVLAWELGNETYLFTTSADGADFDVTLDDWTDYASTAEPFAAQVAGVYADAGRTPVISISENAVTTKFAAAFTNCADGGQAKQYWNAVTHHDYPDVGGVDAGFAVNMEHLNYNLSQAIPIAQEYLCGANQPGTQLLVTEYDPGDSTSPAQGTLYGGIYEAEYALRLSTLSTQNAAGQRLPGVLHVGQHALTQNGILTEPLSPANQAQLTAAEAPSNFDVATGVAAVPVDTSGWNFGFYYSAQAIGLQVANGALYHATFNDATVLTGGSTVPTVNGGVAGTLPALYAQAYQGDDQQTHLVLTNKGSANELVAVTFDGCLLAGPLAETFVTGASPCLTNAGAGTSSTPCVAGSAAGTSPVAAQVASSPNPVAVPPYSVVHLSWPN